jgi:hypothetical protein
LKHLIALVITLVCISQAKALRFVEGQVILDRLDEYNNCQNKDYTGEWCHDALMRWVEAHPADAFKAGKMTRRVMNHSSAIPFFEKAFEAKAGDCKDEDVKLAVVSALGLPPDYELVKPAKKIAFETCFKELKDAIAEEAKPGSYNFQNSCKELDKKGALAGLKKKKCAELK